MIEITQLDELRDSPHAEIFDEHRPRTVRLELDAGESVPAHTHPDKDVVVHVVSGQLALTLDEESYQLAAGELARFSGQREISPSAIEPTTAVVVLAPTEEN